MNQITVYFTEDKKSFQVCNMTERIYERNKPKEPVDLNKKYADFAHDISHGNYHSFSVVEH